MRYLLAPALTLALCVPAFAAFTGPGGAPAGRIQRPLGRLRHAPPWARPWQAPDDALLRAGRNIVSRGPKHERYVFQDATGSITVDIDDKLFAGRAVTPQNTVRLHGEVDVEHYGYREIDVDVLEIVK